MNKTSKQTSKASKPKVGDEIFETMDVVHLDAAGIDIGSELHYVSVPEGRDNPHVRSFGCFTPDLEAMAAWLKECRVKTVVMESTGVYWVPAYQVLEANGFDVKLVDGNHAKDAPGRKTDVWDCRWLRKLHTFGLLRGCFIPPADVTELRTYWRHRANLVETCSQQTMRMHKALEQMNIQLHKAIADVTGVTGMRIIRAIVAGERDPNILAAMRDRRVKAPEETLVKALTGNYRVEHLFTMKQALETFDFLHSKMQECDERIRECMARFKDPHDDPPNIPPPDTLPPEDKRISRRKNEPYFDMSAELKRIFGVDLTQIAGISSLTAMTVLSECGPDLSAFPSERRFCSWLGLSPNHRITGGRVKSNRTRKVSSRLASALRVAAQSLHHSNSALGAFFRRMASRHGMPKAITATAHKLARLVYMMITKGSDYVQQGQTEYEKRHQERRIKSLHKQAAMLGFSIVPATAQPEVS
jgi:transposase